MPSQEVIVGVDFGTTNSVVAFCKSDGVEILTNDIDSRKTPSCVYFKDTDREVGEAALRMAPSFPLHTIRSVKSVLGLPVSVLGKRAPLGAVPFEGSKPDEPLTITISNRKAFSPEEVAAMILMEIKKSAETHLDKQVSKAVIAVPSYFSASQRQAMMDAAFLAGLQVTALVNDTTAAALAYAHDREYKKTVVLVDIGGGGSSMSVVKVACNQVWVQAHSGPRLPGGDDFDDKMVEYLKQLAKKKFDEEVSDPRDSEILRSYWGKAKEKLSRIPQAPIKVFLPGIGQEFDENLQRSDFQEQCGELFKEITDGLLRTMEGVRLEAVDEVLLVGGSSRTPLLRNLIQEELKVKQLSKAINPDEAVAEGAALLAAGCVEVMEERLSLNTEVIFDDFPTNLHRNLTVLPRRLDAPFFGRKATEVHQEVNIGNTVPVVNFRRSGIKCVEITTSGLLRIVENCGTSSLPLFGCLPRAQVEKNLKKMETYRHKEVEESKRVEAKNALERLLRVERIREATPGDRFYDEVMDLRKECGKQLHWLAENSTCPAKKYNEVRSDIERKVAALLKKQEGEKKKVEAWLSLRRTLQAVIGADIPEDPFREKAVKLKQLCEEKLSKFEERERFSQEELQKQQQSVLMKIEDLENDRKLHATQQRNEGANSLFHVVIIEATLRWQKRAMCVPFYSKWCTLKNDALQWLQTHDATTDAVTCNQRRETFEREVSALEDDLNREIQMNEERRRRSYEAAENKLTEALSIKAPQQNDRLYAVTTKYIDGWQSLLKWLQGKPNEEQHKYDMLTTQVCEEIVELRRIQSVEEERMRLTALIESRLTNGLEEFKGNQDYNSLFQRLNAGYQKWLHDNPLASNSDLGTCRARIDGIVESLQTVRRHVSLQEKETASAHEAHEKAMTSAAELLTSFGFVEPSDDLDQKPTSCAAKRASFRGSYVPEQFTRGIEEPMDVDIDEQVKGENKLDVPGPYRNGVRLDDSNMLEVWKCFHKSADQRQWPGALARRTPGQCQAILESLGEAIALEALHNVGLAGFTALLLDREVTEDQELVSLSVRYVSICGDPDERLLLVLNKRTFNGQEKDFAVFLFSRFKELCEKAGVQNKICLEVLSAPDCGRFVPFFVALVNQNGWAVLRVDSISEPLDKRLAVSFYEIAHKDNDIFLTFFSTVDTLRQKLAIDSRWFPLLRRSCNLAEDCDPWLTYSSSTAFLLSHRKKISELLHSVAKSDPKEKMLMDCLQVKLGEYLFIVCLVAFDGVFTELQDDQERDFRSGWKSILSRRRGHETVLMAEKFRESLIERITVTAGISHMTRDDKAHSLVDTVIRSAVAVTDQSLQGFEDCLFIEHCLECAEDKSGGRFDQSENKFHQDLMSLTKKFPQATLDLRSVLHHVPRCEFQRELPALYTAVQRALTVPLLPPMSERSAVQLRQGARRTNAVLRVFNSAAVPIAARQCRPLDETIARAVASVLSKCPELKGTHPGCTSTAL